MDSPATEIARRLAASAEAVCRRYLSNGRREGRYWLVGDVRNSPGRSLYVRLSAGADNHGGAGKWTDAQSGDHGDLLDIIAATCGHTRLRDTLNEARQFLSLPQPTVIDERRRRPSKAPTGTPEAAQRLWAASRPIGQSIVIRYLAKRAISDLPNTGSLRFHPRCYYRASKDDAPDVRSAWPAMIAAVTDASRTITGVHRTWLDPASASKADVAYPRRAMGHLLGSGVWFGDSGPVITAGEGIETILSLRQVMPAMPMVAGLSAAHLAALNLSADVRCLYVACDQDSAGEGALATLTDRYVPQGVLVLPLRPCLDDFNSDLIVHGASQLAAHVRVQLRATDAVRFMLR
jgi:hypothetical protein